jgi:hypothetical protein
MRQLAPWILAAVAVAAIFPAATLRDPKRADRAAEREASRVEEGDGEEGASAQESANPCQAREGQRESPWCEPLRILREFYGLEPVSALPVQKSPARTPGEDPARDGSLGEIKERSAGYRTRFLLALVPDPIESQVPLNFDSALDAIQKGFAQEGYLFDRFWLPWMGEEAKKDRLYRAAPGIILFRRHSPGDRQLALVFLIGESPKSGIHKQAFQQALEIASRLSKPPESRIDILGPSFSGSVDSLVVALEDWRKQHAGTPFRIASGTATAAGLKKKFQGLDNVGFCRTVVPDDLLQKKAFGFLRGSMKWDLRRAAFLTESDTGYGSSSSGAARRIVDVKFPSGIADLRNAWKREEEDQKTGERDIQVADTRISTGREALDLSLQDRDKALDTIPRFSQLSTLARDQELAVLLETISRDDIRYVGVLATDLKDRLFIMERVRRFSPDTILFTFDNDLLLSHVEYSDVMDGVLVISSSPLFTEGASWLPRSSSGDAWERRQFLGEFQQGTFNAVLYLLDARVQSTPQVWVSAVGNGSIWPVARLPLKDPKERAVFCHDDGRPLQPLALSEVQGGLAGKANLQVIFFAVALCLVSWGVRRAGLLAETGSDGSVAWHPVSRPLLVLGMAILALSAAVLLVVASIPEWAWYLSNDWDPSSWKGLRIGFLLALVFFYVYLCLQMVRRPVAEGRFGLLKLTLWGLGIALAPLLLIRLLFVLWMPNGEIAFFQLRARAYSSGLSPIVSLTLIGAAVLVWIVCEIRRRWLTERQRVTDCAMDTLCGSERSIQGCQHRLNKIQSLLDGIFPRGQRPGEHPWLLPLSVFLPLVLVLWGTVQPIVDTRNYGRVFLVFVVVTASLAALSFYRFVRVWWNLRGVLMRLDHISPRLAKTFEALAPELDWKPMRSFGFRIPPFKMLILSAEKLRALLEVRPLAWVSVAELDRLMRQVFDSEGRDMRDSEVRRRQELESLFSRACGELAYNHGAIRLPAVREFLAVRVAVYLRYVFAHLRNCLLGAMGTGLLLLLAVSSYKFEPKQFLSFVIWASLAVAALLTFWIFIQMDRNPTLSRIGGTTAGQVTLDRTFLANVFLYGAVPVLGVIATQFPEVGKVLGQIMDPLLRVVGGG